MAWLSVDKFTESRSVKKWVENEFYQGHRVFDRRAAFITSMLAGDDPTGMLKTVPYGTVAVNMADKKVWIHDATTIVDVTHGEPPVRSSPPTIVSLSPSTEFPLPPVTDA